MIRKLSLLCALALVIASGLRAQTQMQIYGVWHCYTDGCGWLSVPNMTTFDTDNHWLIDRGTGQPSVNLFILIFINLVYLMNSITNSNTTN